MTPDKDTLQISALTPKDVNVQFWDLNIVYFMNYKSLKYPLLCPVWLVAMQQVRTLLLLNNGNAAQS